jgi:hypothetical protein
MKAVARGPGVSAVGGCGGGLGDFSGSADGIVNWNGVWKVMSNFCVVRWNGGRC